MNTLPTPTPGREVEWVAANLPHLCDGPPRASTSHRGGQSAADRALECFDVSGYATSRSVVEPAARRGASALSPWIRHGVLPLRRVWSHVAGGPERDVVAFRDELLWQEYARHLYARLGAATTRPLRSGLPGTRRPTEADWAHLDPDMACTSTELDALHQDGWITNRGRLWLASEWSVRLGLDWAEGEDLMFRELLDGSRAANRLGWQWTSGTGSARPWSWSREQVERLAPGRCATCVRRDDCPVDPEPATVADAGLDTGLDTGLDARLRRDPDPSATSGPSTVQRSGAGRPEAVWTTAESLGDDDPAMAAHPDLPVVFVLDDALLSRLRLATTRLVFLAECLADLSTRRSVEVHLGDPAVVLDGRAVATTAAPVPGHRRIRRRLGDSVAELHPWPWLVPPHDRSVRSFSAWRRHATLP